MHTDVHTKMHTILHTPDAHSFAHSIKGLYCAKMYSKNEILLSFPRDNCPNFHPIRFNTTFIERSVTAILWLLVSQHIKPRPTKRRKVHKNTSQQGVGFEC